MRKIQRVSRFFKWVFQIIFCILPITYIIFWINAPAPVFSTYGFILSFIPQGTMIVSTVLPTDTKLLAFVIGLIPLAVHLFILYFLVRLFRSFEKSEIFSKRNVGHIKWIGYTILIGQLLQPLYQALMSAALTWHNLPGTRVIEISFTGTNVGLVLTALLIILISWIMAEGQKLQEEQEYTV